MAQRGRPPKVSRRRKRGRLDGLNLHMNTPEIPGWKCRWVNDQKNRPYQLNTMDDWEYVLSSEIEDPQRPGEPLVGESVKNPNVESGGFVRMRVGVEDGQVVYAYLMKKPLQFIEEDLAEKHANLDETDRQLGLGISPVEHQRGKVTIT